MQTPLEIRFHGLAPSDALSAKIASKVNKLERFCGRIIGCLVLVEMPHHSKTKGNEFRVHIELDVPQEKLVIDRSLESEEAPRAVHVLIRDAFDAMKRKLQEYTGRRQDWHHDRPTPEEEEIGSGIVTKLFPGEGYGFIEAPDGHEVYFHENALTNQDFEGVEIGQKVRFHEENGLNGPQAAYVTVTSRRLEATHAAV